MKIIPAMLRLFTAQSVNSHWWVPIRQGNHFVCMRQQHIMTSYWTLNTSAHVIVWMGLCRGRKLHVLIFQPDRKLCTSQFFWPTTNCTPHSVPIAKLTFFGNFGPRTKFSQILPTRWQNLPLYTVKYTNMYTNLPFLPQFHITCWLENFSSARPYYCIIFDSCSRFYKQLHNPYVVLRCSKYFSFLHSWLNSVTH